MNLNSTVHVSQYSCQHVSSCLSTKTNTNCCCLNRFGCNDIYECVQNRNVCWRHAPCSLNILWTIEEDCGRSPFRSSVLCCCSELVYIFSGYNLLQQFRARTYWDGVTCRCIISRTQVMISQLAALCMNRKLEVSKLSNVLVKIMFK